MPYIPSGTELLHPFQILERVGLRQGMQVTDLGCGALGHFVFPAAELVGKTGTVYAVDILKSALSNIESKSKMMGASNVRSVWSDIEIVGAAHIPAGTSDVVLLVNNLTKQTMIAEACRLLKPGGMLLIVDWKLSATPFGPPSKDRIDKEIAKNMAHDEKLQFKEEWDAGQYHYALLFIK